VIIIHVDLRYLYVHGGFLNSKRWLASNGLFFNQWDFNGEKYKIKDIKGY
jgi:hypothetical protein